ncbi:MAG: hypothetical protein GOU98_01645, partial [Candidatus Altiarchaeota archaeon]|nr:hypothetical protein [Candidatus Altiarchaeota archaeon]
MGSRDRLVFAVLLFVLVVQPIYSGSVYISSAYSSDGCHSDDYEGQATSRGWGTWGGTPFGLDCEIMHIESIKNGAYVPDCTDEAQGDTLVCDDAMRVKEKSECNIPGIGNDLIKEEKDVGNRGSWSSSSTGTACGRLSYPGSECKTCYDDTKFEKEGRWDDDDACVTCDMTKHTKLQYVFGPYYRAEELFGSCANDKSDDDFMRCNDDGYCDLIFFANTCERGCGSDYSCDEIIPGNFFKSLTDYDCDGGDCTKYCDSNCQYIDCTSSSDWCEQTAGSTCIYGSSDDGWSSGTGTRLFTKSSINYVCSGGSNYDGTNYCEKQSADSKNFLWVGSWVDAADLVYEDTSDNDRIYLCASTGGQYECTSDTGTNKFNPCDTKTLDGTKYFCDLDSDNNYRWVNLGTDANAED